MKLIGKHQTIRYKLNKNRYAYSSRYIETLKSWQDLIENKRKFSTSRISQLPDSIITKTSIGISTQVE